MVLPLPILSPRLRLEPPRIGDGKWINEAVLSNIENISQWMPWAKPVPDVETSEEFVRSAVTDFAARTTLVMLIWNRHTGQLLGSSGFHEINWDVPSFETGYWLRGDALGQGYVVEAVNALTRYAFQVLGAKRLAIHCDRDNFKSRAVPETLGFNLDGVLRNHLLKVDRKELRDTFIYSRIDLDGLPELDVDW
ncbi:MAG: GNAT family N-acetyltransferase [Bdellovibrionota bacterium]